MTIPQSLAGAIAAARSVAVLTGAGVSAESGVPTFRDAQTGLWAQFDPQKLATPDAFRRNPKLVWDWYAWRRKLVAEADPTPVIARLPCSKDAFPISC
jgi:NAD-dependent protein deacetylase/lipoamidase